MDLFTTTYDPTEWDLVSHRSDGEYLSVTDNSDSDNDSHHSCFDSDSSLPLEELNFLDIKMMSSFVDLNSLLVQKSSVESKLSALTPYQFHLYDHYSSQLECLNEQIQALQQPIMVTIQHYTPTDAEFVPTPAQPPVIQPYRSITQQETKGKALSLSPSMEEQSLENIIFHLEQEISEKENLVRDLWKTLKL
jgi:hypothetical protein